MNEELQLIGIGVWLVVALIIVGVARETSGEWPEWGPGAALWPMVVPIAAAVGVGWCVMWIGRAPVLLIRHRRRVKLPRAEVRR